MMKARPLFAGVTRRNSTSASNPPAEAPIPTTHGEGTRLPGGEGTCCSAARRAGFDFLPRLTAIARAQLPKARVYVTRPCKDSFDLAFAFDLACPWPARFPASLSGQRLEVGGANASG